MRRLFASLVFLAAISFGFSALAEDLAQVVQDEVQPPPTEATQKNEEVIEKGTVQLKGKTEKVEAVTKQIEKEVTPLPLEEESAKEKTDEMSVTMKPAKKSKEKSKKESTPQAAKDVDAETSLRWLQNGNTRFVKKNLRADGKSAADRKRVLGQDKPHAIVLSCSDSRVPPEIVFDQALGEIFVIRVAGQALDSSVLASIEHAVAKLGPQLIVVMGHSHCAAVEAALNLKDGESAESADLEKLLNDIKPRLKTVSKDAPSTSLEVESAVNADGVARDLVRRSELIRKQVEAGRLTIKTALYRMDTGKVNFY